MYKTIRAWFPYYESAWTCFNKLRKNNKYVRNTIINNDLNPNLPDNKMYMRFSHRVECVCTQIELKYIAKVMNVTAELVEVLNNNDEWVEYDAG